MWIGLFLVGLGILILLSNMDILRGDVWNYIWPLVLVLFGISLIFKRPRKHKIEISASQKEDTGNIPRGPA